MRRNILLSVLMLSLGAAGCVVHHQHHDPPPAGKVAICHKGKKTIYVPESAVKAHLGHGDYPGRCR